MKPTWQTEDGAIQLWCGDALSILPTFEAGSVDCVIVDPPYGVLNEDWDDMTVRELARFTMTWLGFVSGLSDTLVTFFAQEKRNVIDPLLYVLYDEQRQLIWNKLGGRVSEDGMFYSFEPIYYCHPKREWSVCEPKALEVAGAIKQARVAAGMSRGGVDMLVRGKKTGLCYRWEEAACLPTSEQVAALKRSLPLNGTFDQSYSEAIASRDIVLQMAREKASANAARRLDVFSFSPIQGDENRHPAQKPLPLIEGITEVATSDGETILDPFMGSGTTGVACVRLGRKFLGIEKEPRYFDLAVSRITAELNRCPLFPDPAPTQRSLLPEASA